MYKINIKEKDKLTLLQALYDREETIKGKLYDATSELIKDDLKNSHTYWIEKLKRLSESINDVNHMIKTIKDSTNVKIPDIENEFDE